MNDETIRKFAIEKFGEKVILNKPDDITDFDGLEYKTALGDEKLDMVFTFIFTIDEFKEGVKAIVEKDLLNPGGVAYFAYPKKGNKRYKQYIGRDDFFAVVEMDSDGYVFNSPVKFNKMAALNEVFTVVGLKHEEKRKKTTQPSQCVADYIDRVPDIKNRLKENEEISAFYESLPPGYQRDWARYVFGVKNPETTEKRFAEMEIILKQGYKSIDLYRRKD